MPQAENGTPQRTAGLEELDLALEELETLVDRSDESARLALESLGEDAEDLERLACMAAEGLSDIDIFDTLRLDGSEGFHSNFLAWLMKPKGSHGLGGYFLREFLNSGGARGAIPVPAIDGTTVTREHYIELEGGTGRLDIRIFNEKSNFLCAIENKVWAPESGAQLAFYRRALKLHYPDYRVKLLFLTPHGAFPDDPEEQKRWRRMSYTDILRLLERTLEEKGNKVTEDVKALLRQYATTLRRNIVPDVSNDVHQLARRIYRKHKQAINLITEHRDRYEPNYITEGFGMVKAAVGKRPEWRESTCNHAYARFMSSEWSNKKELEIKQWPGYLVQFQVHVTHQRAELSLFLSWKGNQELKKRILDRLSARSELFVGDFPSDTGDNIELRVGNILEKSDYETWWDEEKTRETISSRLDEFANGKFREINEIVMDCLEH